MIPYPAPAVKEVYDVLEYSYAPTSLMIRRTEQQQNIGMLTTIGFIILHLIFLVPYSIIIAGQIWMQFTPEPGRIPDDLDPSLVAIACVQVLIALVVFASMLSVIRQLVFLMFNAGRPFVFDRTTGIVYRGKNALGRIGHIEVIWVRSRSLMPWHQHVLSLRFNNRETFDIVDHLAGLQNRNEALRAVAAIGVFIGLVSPADGGPPMPARQM